MDCGGAGVKDVWKGTEPGLSLPLCRVRWPQQEVDAREGEEGQQQDVGGQFIHA